MSRVIVNIPKKEYTVEHTCGGARLLFKNVDGAISYRYQHIGESNFHSPIFLPDFDLKALAQALLDLANS